MKKCPVCHQTFTNMVILRKNLSKSMPKLLKEQFTDGKNVIRFPHCGVRLRKKVSIWFIPAFLPFLISAWLTTVNRQYSFLMIPSIVIFMIFYVNLPYVPYDN